MSRPRVAILAQDLIWADRLARAVEAAGGEPARAKTAPELDRALVCAEHAIVDLTAHAYDPIAAVERARSSGARVLAVGQHDDLPLRKRAFAAGADKVLAYRKLFDDGPATITRWLADAVPRRAVVMTTATRPTIPAARYTERLERAIATAAGRGLDALLVGVGPDLDYLTGYRAMPLERLTMLVITPADGGLRLVVPRLEEPAARVGCRAEVEIVTWEETDDPHGLVARFVTSASGTSLAMQGSAGRPEVAVSARLMAMHVLPLQERLASARFRSAAGVMSELRIRKDGDEIELLRQAGAAADRVVAQIAAGRLVGRTEADVAEEVRERLRAEGHELAQFAIVASGPNSASPHHEASDRVIQAGEPIVLDIGGVLGGYCSDTTRTLWVTGGAEANGPDEEFRHLFGVLHAAQQAASGAVRPGVPAEAIDRAARDIIDGEGYGANFFHRTGHGIGLDGHEDPYLVAGNAQPLEEGMAFSVEPGIYLPGRYGARIEDIVACGPNGPIILNNESRELRVVPG